MESARLRIDRDLRVHPWMDVAAQRVRSSLRRHLLGEDADDIDAARDEHTFRRRPAERGGPRPALLLSGLDKADPESLERLTRLFAGEHRPTWPLLLRFDARPPAGAARALLEQLESALPAEAIFEGADDRPRAKGPALPADAIARLSHEASRVLRAAATTGDRFEVETVAELLDVDEVEVLDAVQEALDRGLSLEDRGHGVFRFEPRVGAALRQVTLPALSEAWHRRLAELFGGLPAPSERKPPESWRPSAPREAASADDAMRSHPPAALRDEGSGVDAECPPTMPEAGACLAVQPGAPAAIDDGRPASWWMRLGAEAANAVPAAGRGVVGSKAGPASPRPLSDAEDAGCDDGRSARHAEAAGLRQDAAERYVSSALAAVRAGAHARALDAAGRALALAEGMPEPERGWLEASALLVIGQCRWLARGDGPASLDMALEALERAYERAAAAPRPELQAEIATMIANVCYDLGTSEALERALVEVTRASRLWLDARRPFEAARLLNDEAAVWVKRGNPVRANQLLARSREVFARLASAYPAARLELLETEHLLARLMLHAPALPGREREALESGVEHALVAEAGYSNLHEQRQLARVWETLGRLKLRLGELEEGTQQLARAHRLQREIGDAIGAARSAGGMSEAFAAAHDYPRALSSLAESVAFNSEKGSSAGLQHNLATLRQLEARLPAALIEQASALGQRLVHALSVN
ncbi:MAG TPA: hypothetical protein VMG12_05270 [Polyangiaceae bacterium]|nr:hypothetical protein [Polyangiaceae bacterium]